MKLTIDDRFLVIFYESAEEERLTRDAFSYDDMSAVYMGGRFDKRKIKRKCFVNSKKTLHLLNSGFLFELITLLKQKNIPLSELLDRRSTFSHNQSQCINHNASTIAQTDIRKFFPANFKYVDHQIEALQRMLKVNCGMIQAPTSSGKSEIIIAYIKATKLPALIVVNRVSLAMQLRDRLIKNGIEAGICHSKEYTIAPVMISTIGSIDRINTGKFQVLILDEVHRAQASTYQKFLKTHSFPIRFGFSATPDCGDKYRYATIRQYMGSVIYKVDIKELIENEVVARPKINFVKNNVEDPRATNWVTAYDTCIVHNEIRNKKIKNLVKEHDLPTLILVRIIDHGKKLNDSIPESVFVSGIDDALYRKEVIEKFEKGEIKTIISSNIFNEGISIDAIRLLIIASGGKSKIETIQKLGRGLRVKQDKTECTVFDFEDEGNMYTERHSLMRKNIYLKAGFEILE